MVVQRLWAVLPPTVECSTAECWRAAWCTREDGGVYIPGRLPPTIPRGAYTQGGTYSPWERGSLPCMFLPLHIGRGPLPCMFPVTHRERGSLPGMIPSYTQGERLSSRHDPGIHTREKGGLSSQHVSHNPREKGGLSSQHASHSP